MPNRNVVFAFFGGIMIGCAATYAVLRKTGKIANLIDPESNIPEEEKAETEEGTPRGDKPSFNIKEKVETGKINYSSISDKPSINSLAAKYEVTRDSEDSAEDEDLQDEIAEALTDHIGQEDEYYEEEGYGHYISQLNNGRKGEVIFLIPEEYLGEIYSIEDLVYYEGDDVLCDILDAPVVDPVRVVGPALEHFGEFDDPDKVYIRNCHMGFEYEITRKPETFGAHIYGLKLDEDDYPKKKSRKPQEGDE